MDLTRLRVLAAVADCGSVTGAATLLHYAQPSVSHHLARLEAEVGVPLVQKAGRGIRLTPEGLLLARRAAEILGRVEAAEAEMAALARLETGRVRVAGFQSALSTIVAEAASALRSSYPLLEVSLTDAHPDQALKLLRAGAVDVAVVFRYDDEPPPQVVSRRLFDDPMCLLSSEAGQTLEDHRESTWIAGCEGCRKDMVDHCASKGFVPRVSFTSDDIVVEQALVAAGLGVCTMPRLALRAHRRDGIHATELPDFRRRVHLATFGEPPHAPATGAFVAALLNAVSALVD